MKKITFVLIAVMIVFSVAGTTAFAAEEVQPAVEKTYDCPTLPSRMKPGSMIEYIDDTTIKILKGGFLSADYKKDLSKPGMYDKPVKGMIVDYCDDTYIGHIKYPDGVQDPSLIPLKTDGLKARASAKSNTITLTWKHNGSALWHRVYRSTTKNGPYKLIKKITWGVQRFNDKGLTQGKTYYYKLVPTSDVKGKIVKGPTTDVVSAAVRD